MIKALRTFIIIIIIKLVIIKVIIARFIIFIYLVDLNFRRSSSPSIKVVIKNLFIVIVIAVIVITFIIECSYLYLCDSQINAIIQNLV